MSSYGFFPLHHLFTAAFILSLALLVPGTAANDSRDPGGNVTIKWDVMQWTADGYVAVVTMYNYQKYRSIDAPGWKLGWTWKRNELIWEVKGAEPMKQGDCSKFHFGMPQSCEKKPVIKDLKPGVPIDVQVSHCCKGGVLAAWGKDPSNALASFQITVGFSGNTNTTVFLPSMFMLWTPSPAAYSCGPAHLVQPSIFLSADGRRQTQALMTWKLICVYSKFGVHKEDD